MGAPRWITTSAESSLTLVTSTNVRTESAPGPLTPMSRVAASTRSGAISPDARRRVWCATEREFASRKVVLDIPVRAVDGVVDERQFNTEPVMSVGDRVREHFRKRNGE